MASWILNFWMMKNLQYRPDMRWLRLNVSLSIVQALIAKHVLKGPMIILQSVGKRFDHLIRKDKFEFPAGIPKEKGSWKIVGSKFVRHHYIKRKWLFVPTKTEDLPVPPERIGIIELITYVKYAKDGSVESNYGLVKPPLRLSLKMLLLLHLMILQETSNAT